MISGFQGQPTRDLPDRDYVDSMRDGPLLLNHVSKFCRVLPRRNFSEIRAEIFHFSNGLVSRTLHTFDA